MGWGGRGCCCCRPSLGGRPLRPEVTKVSPPCWRWLGSQPPGVAPLQTDPACPCRGEGWARVAPEVASELQAQLREGEFWVDEEEFLREFDEVTVAYPLSTAGHLQSLYTGEGLLGWGRGRPS